MAMGLLRCRGTGDADDAGKHLRNEHDQQGEDEPSTQSWPLGAALHPAKHRHVHSLDGA